MSAWPSQRATTIADQFVSSISNWVVLLIAARWLSTDHFAIFSVIQAGCLIGLGVVRGLMFEPLLLERGVRRHRLSRGTVTRPGAVAVAVCMLAGGLLLSLGMSRWAIAVSMGGSLVLQDGWRYYAIAQCSPGRALMVDATWAAVAPAALFALASDGSLTAADALTAWLLGASGSAIAGVVLLGKGTRDTREEHKRRQGASFAMEFILTSSALHLSILLIAVTASGALVGSARLALSTVGVLGIVRRGALTHLLANARPAKSGEVVRLVRSAARRAVIRALPLCLLATAALWIGHERMLGRQDGQFVVIFALAAAAVAVGLGTNQLIVALRLLGDGGDVLRIQAFMFPVLVIAPAAGAWLLDAWGLGLGVLASVALTFVVMSRALGARAPTLAAASRRPSDEALHGES